MFTMDTLKIQNEDFCILENIDSIGQKTFNINFISPELKTNDQIKCPLEILINARDFSRLSVLDCFQDKHMELIFADIDKTNVKDFLELLKNGHVLIKDLYHANDLREIGNLFGINPSKFNVEDTDNDEEEKVNLSMESDNSSLMVEYNETLNENSETLISFIDMEMNSTRERQLIDIPVMLSKHNEKNLVSNIDDKDKIKLFKGLVSQMKEEQSYSSLKMKNFHFADIKRKRNPTAGNLTYKLKRLKQKIDNEPSSIEDKLKSNFEYDEDTITNESETIFYRCRLCYKVYDYNCQFNDHYMTHLKDKIGDLVELGKKNSMCPIGNERKNCCQKCFKDFDPEKQRFVKHLKNHIVLHHGLFLDLVNADKEKIVNK